MIAKVTNFVKGISGNVWIWIAAGIAALALIAAIIIGINHALASAKQAGRDEVQAKWDAEKAGAANARAELSDALAEAFNGLDGTLQKTVKTISTKGQEITVRLKKEIDNDPRYRSVECSLTPGVQDGLNAARGLSHAVTASSVDSGDVPASGAPVRLNFGPPRPGR